MPKKKQRSSVGQRRKKRNHTTTPANTNAAKRLKTDDKSPAEYRDGLLHGIRVLLGKMDDKDLLAVMMHVGSMEQGEKQKSTASQPATTGTTAVPAVTATATAIQTATMIHESTATATINPTTTESTTTTVPPSPQEEDPVIQLKKNTRVSPHNIVTIDPRCLHCDGRTELEATKCKNKSVNNIVNAIVQNNLTPEQRAFALKQKNGAP